MEENYKALNPALRWLWDMLSFYSTEEIQVPDNFNVQVYELKRILRSDTSGLVNSVIDFMINSANVKYKIETSNTNLNEVIDNWLETINYDMLGKIPLGVQSLSKEYFRERWKNSSLIVLRTLWDYKSINGEKYYLPTKMWFEDGEFIKVENPDKYRRVLGEENYSIKITDKKKINLPEKDNEKIFVQKPFNSWINLYSTPYLYQRGVWRNLKIYELINKKSERIVGKAIEYLMLLKKGSAQLAGNPDYTYSTDDLKAVKDGFKKMINDSKSEAGAPSYVTGFDTDLEHVIPEFSKILNESLYTNVEKRILAGLGLIDIVEGSSSNRRESILNPKPMIAEIEQGIQDFISLLSNVITTIKIENVKSHPKYLNEEIELHSTTVKYFISDSLRDHFRSMYDRGLLSKETYMDVIGEFDIDVERKLRMNETDKKDEKTFYPPVIQNSEGKGIDLIKDKETIPPDKKGPEAKNYKGEYEEAPYNKISELPDSVKVLPPEGQSLWMRVFNRAYPKGEDYARKVAWTVVKKLYKKDGDNWVKKGSISDEDMEEIANNVLEKSNLLNSTDSLSTIKDLLDIELKEKQIILANKMLGKD